MKKLIACGLALSLSLVLTKGVAHAISLGFVPASQDVGVGNPFSVDLLISGLGNFAPPSLGTFDLTAGFDPAILTFIGATFGPFLGDPAAGQALTAVTNPLPGSVNLFEVSFLDSRAVILPSPSKSHVFPHAVVPQAL